MQEKASQPPSDKEKCKQEVHDLIEKVDVLQKQSINLFDQKEVRDRVSQVLENLDANVHELNHCYADPNSDQTRALQDLFFNVKKMKESLELLQREVHSPEHQQTFIAAIDHMKEFLNRLH